MAVMCYLCNVGNISSIYSNWVWTIEVSALSYLLWVPFSFTFSKSLQQNKAISLYHVIESPLHSREKKEKENRNSIGYGIAIKTPHLRRGCWFKMVDCDRRSKLYFSSAACWKWSCSVTNYVLAKEQDLDLDLENECV